MERCPRGLGPATSHVQQVLRFCRNRRFPTSTYLQSLSTPKGAWEIGPTLPFSKKESLGEDQLLDNLRRNSSPVRLGSSDIHEVGRWFCIDRCSASMGHLPRTRSRSLQRLNALDPEVLPHELYRIPQPSRAFCGNQLASPRLCRNLTQRSGVLFGITPDGLGIDLDNW